MILYLFAITFGLCISYLILFFLFPYFFENTRKIRISYRSIISIIVICLVSYVSVASALSIHDKEIGNRLLHVFGGGFTAFLVCFLAIKDSGLKIRRFQFFLISFLIVTFLGVVNEVVEFFLQYYFNFISASRAIDTWLDLTSNIVGALIASVCMVPFIPKKVQTQDLDNSKIQKT